MTQEEQILHKAKELFFKLGVRSITMDDLSRELGISKKTLYQFVANKADLVEKVLVAHFREETIFVNQAILDADNAIDEVFRIAKNSLKQFRKMHPSSIYDIKKYYPKAWNVIEEFKSDYIYTCIKENIEKGKKEGFYRKQINGDVIARLYINSIDFIVNPFNFPPSSYHFSELYKEFINYHLQGMATEKGHHYLMNIQLEDDE